MKLLKKSYLLILPLMLLTSCENRVFSLTAEETYLPEPTKIAFTTGESTQRQLNDDDTLTFYQKYLKDLKFEKNDNIFFNVFTFQYYYDFDQYLYGDGNCSNLDIGELDERFSTAELAGKLVNIGDDISDEFLSGRSISMFKKIVSGNPLKGEYKGENIFFFKPYVKLFFSANEIPRMKDKTGAVLRRMVIIPFNARFTPDDPDYDPYIVTKLKSEESVQYLIRLGIAGLKRVLANKDFTHATVVAKALAAYELENNPILSFINDVTVEGIVERPTDDVYKQYCVYCYENGFKALSKIPFSRELTRNSGIKVKVVKVAGKSIKQYVVS